MAGNVQRLIVTAVCYVPTDVSEDIQLGITARFMDCNYKIKQQIELNYSETPEIMTEEYAKIWIKKIFDQAVRYILDPEIFDSFDEGYQEQAKKFYATREEIFNHIMSDQKGGIWSKVIMNITI